MSHHHEPEADARVEDAGAADARVEAMLRDAPPPRGVSVSAMRTIMQMLGDRGLPAAAAPEYDVGAGGFVRTRLPLAGGAEAMVLFVVAQRVRAVDVQQALAAAGAGKAASIVVLAERQSDATMRGVAALPAETFLQVELLSNKSRHVLVPRHERLPPAELPALLASLGLAQRSALPTILRSDPQARYLGLKPGEVVRISRPSPSAGVSTVYRVCA